MTHLSRTHSSLPRPLALFSCLSLLLLLLLTCPVALHGQECNKYSCSPDQGSPPNYPANSCDSCNSNSNDTNSCSSAYYSSPGFSCGIATRTVNGEVTLRRSQCCPSNYDGESEFVCVSERHNEDDGIVDGYSCVKVGEMVSVMRVGMLVGAIVCIVLFAAIALGVWRMCIKVPQQRVTLPQYQQPLVDNVPQSLSLNQSSQPAAPYQPPAPHVPQMSEHHPQYDQLSEANSQ